MKSSRKALKLAYLDFKKAERRYLAAKMAIIKSYCTCATEKEYSLITEEHFLGCRYRQLLKSIEEKD